MKQFSNDSERKDVKKINLTDVKSKHIRNLIFSFLDEKVKLDIIKYNKLFQNSLSINIDNRMNSRKYIIEISKGNVKEYMINTKVLIFEGEYKNNKRNGRGIEYHYGKMVFSGEYLNGKRNGQGTEFKPCIIS